MPTFYDYFKENMESLNLAAPTNLFGTQQTAIATINGILSAIDKFGTRVTVLEIAGAGTRLELLGAIGAVGAAYYAGAAIGSLAVATGRTLAGGTSLGDVLFEMSKRNWNRQWLTLLLQRRPGIYDQKARNRRHYKLHESLR